MQKAVFLDRDGVINHDPGDYTKNVDEFHFLPGLFDTLRLINAYGFEIIVVTNQGGIARGIYSLQDFKKTDAYMHKRFQEEHIRVMPTFFCPHHELAGKCLCRKPKSLLVERAIARYQISAADSVFVGDKERDIACAEGAGVRGILIPTNALLENYLHLFVKNNV